MSHWISVDLVTWGPSRLLPFEEIEDESSGRRYLSGREPVQNLMDRLNEEFTAFLSLLYKKERQSF